MGIVEKILAEFELADETEWSIEYNKGDTLHMHIDNIRIDFSPEEFQYFASVVAEGRDTLIETKELAADTYHRQPQ